MIRILFVCHGNSIGTMAYPGRRGWTGASWDGDGESLLPFDYY